LSGIDINQQSFVVFNSSTFVIEQTFDDLDKWYEHTIKAEFSNEYFGAN